VSPYQVHFVGLSAGWGRDSPTLQTILPYIIKQNAHICKMFMALSAKFARYLGKTCYDGAAWLKMHTKIRIQNFVPINYGKSLDIIWNMGYNVHALMIVIIINE
jgi:hypothetical protein